MDMRSRQVFDSRYHLVEDRQQLLGPDIKVQTACELGRSFALQANDNTLCLALVSRILPDIWGRKSYSYAECYNHEVPLWGCSEPNDH